MYLSNYSGQGQIEAKESSEEGPEVTTDVKASTTPSGVSSKALIDSEKKSE